MADPRIGQSLGRYHIDAVLGRGGMGVVYRAHQERLERDVAVKVIAPELARDEGFRERFIRESRAAAAIEHPSVVPVYEAGELDDGTLFLAMRFVEGTDLGAILRKEGRLEPARATSLLGQVAAALDEAHASGLVHRDVKPANVLVSSRRGEERAFLTDFGLTKRTASEGGLTATGQWVGTVDYAAPEQIADERVDARADVYSLGCVLYHALTGTVPFQRETELAKLLAHASDPPPRPSDARHGLPPTLDEVVVRAMAKDPEERFPSAGDLGRAAIAAAEGRSARTSERTVTAGGAAPTVPAASAPTAGAPAPEKTATKRVRRGGRRRLLGASAAAAVLAIAAGAAALAGVFDSNGRTGPADGKRAPAGAGEGPLEGIAFTTLDAAGAYTVEVPEGWEVIVGPEAQSSETESLLSTQLRSPGGGIRLTVNRRPGETGTPAEQAAAGESAIAGQPGYERLRFEPTEIAGRDSFVWEFTKNDQQLGAARSTAFFLSLPNGCYRIQGNARLGGDRPARAGALARHAARTLDR